MKPHSLLVKRISAHCDVKTLGPDLPQALKAYRNYIPTFMHGKRITFGHNVSENGNRTRRVFAPNVHYAYLYSRALNLNVYCRVSSETLRRVDEAGGFDEYLLKVSDRLIGDDWAANMIKNRVRKAWAEKKDEIFKEERDVLERNYGENYAK
ncbi:39S ribosomal protein L24, mitochondrial [Nowakowskiella sp. JEL0407]|nr:39S ribosomal protein L24, mitochondrial [Nowakowskiella sp. JEL0407]